MLDRAARAGAIGKRLPIHLTEFGIQSEPDPVNGVSFQRQEEYRSISERIAWTNPRVARSPSTCCATTTRSAAFRASRATAASSPGCKTASGKPKAALSGFRLPLVARRGKRSGVTLWGLVRPGAGGGRTATVEYSFNKGKSWRKLATVATDGRGYWKKGTRYRKGRSYRVTWVSPAGQAYVGATVRPYR